MDDLKVSLFFPVYRDERTVRIVTEKAVALLSSLCEEYEVIIIDDGSPDRSGEIADELTREYAEVRVVHHPSNQGYGAAVRSGLAACRFDTICQTDGDDEYEVEDFRKLLKLRDRYDLVITFRYKKVYSSWRILVSWVYNRLLRLLFRTPFRDVSTGLRMLRRSVLEDIHIVSTSPFVGAEIAIKAMLKGYAVGEVGIQTFPRAFGRGATVTLPNIIATMADVWRIYGEVFSDSYDLPSNRLRT
ncbi:MAG TPA: glycosyltransferase family 2 protein [Vicinamibacteria bacterium]|nr:glycosyltransferase family 2 protein [Vicinamibacteria bacterium]